MRELQHLLLGWECMGDLRRQAFMDAFACYLDFYREHVALEESAILPVALEVLTSSDWEVLDSAFLSNRDVLTGKYPMEATYTQLFSRIARRAPAPLGLGA